MISMSDIPVDQFRKHFGELGIPVAFLVPTLTGYEKSIMDAVEEVRSFLKETRIHDYSKQQQGPEHKVRTKAFFVHPDHFEASEVSLYRPITKQGDPRIWFCNLKKYCNPKNLLALLAVDQTIFVLNLSSQEIRTSLFENKGSVHIAVQRATESENSVANELLEKLRSIHAQGFIPGIIPGPTSIGMTLEKALEIPPNSSKQPDYKGIEIKATRKQPTQSHKNRVTLFSQIPDWELSQTTPRDIILNNGYCAEHKGSPRWNLYCTVKANIANPQGLYFIVDLKKDRLVNYAQRGKTKEMVAIWPFATLRSRLKEKHKETFWVVAKTITKNGIEYFRYDSVVHTKKPKAFRLPELIDECIITMDYTMHLKEDNINVRDHGYLFKINPDKIDLLFPMVEKISLGENIT